MFEFIKKLFGSKTRLRPEDVFTPRAAEINQDMYVNRTDLEAKIRDTVAGTRHLIIHGESGNGKSWLYKKVFSDLDVAYVVVNLANASRLGSLNAAISDKIERDGGERLLESSRSGSFGLRLTGIGPEKSGSQKFAVGQKEPFEWLLKTIRDKAKDRAACIVFDNFEQIINNAEILKQISDCIILLDDEDYSKYRVKICIVGVPADIKDYVSRQGHVDTIANRIIELPEVARLTQQQAEQLLKRGLEDKLKYKVSDPEAYKTIMWRTDRIAQHLHEVGLEVSKLADKEGAVTSFGVDRATKTWIGDSLSAARSVIEGKLNARETKAGRRNQTIYALGQCTLEEFGRAEIEELVRREFPNSTAGVSLNIGGLLSELAEGNNPLIRRIPKGDAFRFVNPKYRMAIRTILQKTEGENVEKIAEVK